MALTVETNIKINPVLGDTAEFVKTIEKCKTEQK